MKVHAKDLNGHISLGAPLEQIQTFRSFAATFIFTFITYWINGLMKGNSLVHPVHQGQEEVSAILQQQTRMSPIIKYKQIVMYTTVTTISYSSPSAHAPAYNIWLHSADESTSHVNHLLSKELYPALTTAIIKTSRDDSSTSEALEISSITIVIVTILHCPVHCNTYKKMATAQKIWVLQLINFAAIVSFCMVVILNI